MKQEITSQCQKCNSTIEQRYLREGLCFNCWHRKQIQINKQKGGTENDIQNSRF